MATTSTASNVHIRKRQYAGSQPPITSYFAGGHSTTSRVSSSALSPPLPPETQASLISVGMRVRKSVPEGYKTHKTLGMDGLAYPSTAPAVKLPHSQLRYDHAPARELMPFCGLHKVGGLGVQMSAYTPPSSAPAIMGRGDMDDGDEPDLTMSQRTMDCTPGVYIFGLGSAANASTKKRTFEEEIEEELDAFFDDVKTDDLPVTVRPIAKVKFSVRSPTMEKIPIIQGDHDFEDAGFLAPMEVDC
ncbi:hypothetical protein LTR62_004901 [Meristemomyces frigidus]|uniref:Uncharacterized protein n=1 Tax=Meristemomyces frigidus TaxID=1508187 RepID=A0AAN7TEN5_9PEZI|nr:hypothetical protein LTR62_004901 [Meristemomyces frigidus]